MKSSNSSPPLFDSFRRREQRSIRNYLLDTRFQLKYTAISLVSMLVISALLGAFLWRTSRQVVAESQTAVEESRKVTAVVKMSMREDGVSTESPELAAAFTAASAESDRIAEARQQSLLQQQSRMFYGVVGSLGVMVLLVTVLTIVLTHRVAGPVYKMNRLLADVSNGRLSIQTRLRRNDELKGLFANFTKMVESVRVRQERQLEDVDNAIELARQTGANPELVAKLSAIRESVAPPPPDGRTTN